MATSERIDISILVVDDDPSALTITVSLLRSWDYQVVTANNGHEALKTLSEFPGFFDLVITDLHMPRMNGFELQNHVKKEFQIPVIMMSTDKRKSVMSRSLANGAAFYIVKPLSRDDFKDIWQYAVATRKEKFLLENELGSEEGESSSGEKTTASQDVNSAASSSSVTENNRRKKGGRRNGKRKGEEHSEGSSRTSKKPKVIWTTSLHNRFLLALRQIGLNRAVPKRILETMNVPGLTRENVASHLQKYRIFLRKVAEKGLLEGLTEKALKSSFASCFPTSLVKDIQKRLEQLRLPVQQKLRSPATVLNPSSNLGPIGIQDIPSSTRISMPQLPNLQLSNTLNRNPILQDQRLFKTSSLNQVRLGIGQSNFGSNQANNFQNPLFPYAQPQQHYQANPTPIFPGYGSLGNGFMTSANSLTGGMNYGTRMYNNYGSLENSSFSHGPVSRNQLVPYGRFNVPQSSTNYPRNNYSGIQLNAPSMAANGMDHRRLNNNSSFGLINGTSNANMPVVPVLGGGNSGLSQGWGASFAGFDSASGFSSELISKSTQDNILGLPPLPEPRMGGGNYGLSQGWGASFAGVESASGFSSALISKSTQDNISGLPPLPERINDLGNAGDEHQFSVNSTSTENEACQFDEVDLNELFLMLSDIHLLNETEENPHASDVLDSDLFSSFHVEQSPEQPQGGGDVLSAPSTESSTNLPNESQTLSDENPNQLLDNDGFADSEPFDMYLADIDSSSASNSANTEQVWDMHFLESLFGNEEN